MTNKEYQAAYYTKNREKILARQKAANELRKDQIREYGSEYARNNREYINANRRALQDKNKAEEDSRRATSEVIGPATAAGMLGISLRSFRQWVTDGKIPSAKTPTGRRIINRADIEAMVEATKTTTPQNPNAVKTLAMVRKVNDFVVPNNFDLITDYSQLTEYTYAFAGGKINFLLLVGSPGSGKSRQMKTDVHETGCTWIDNHVTNLGLYCSVFEAHNRPVVLDDVNHFLKNKLACSLIKALTQTEKVRGVSWENPNVKLFEDKQIPRSYTTSSPICLIANQWDATDPDMAAIQDRALPVAFFPSAETIHNRVIELGWCVDTEIIDFIGENLVDIPSPSMREYYQAAQYKNIGVDWRAKMKSIWGI